MSAKPLVSLIIPVYNVENYLDACMESVVAQTCKDLQIILVDDGAKDSSGTMCDRWAEKDSRIQVIHQANKGLSGARNTGIDAATGEYLMFVDSDDILDPRLVQILLDSLGEDADVSVCDCAHIFPKEAQPFCAVADTETLTPEEATRQMWYQTSFLPSAWAKLYRRELFATRRFTQGRLFEDIDIMHEIFADARHICYNPSKLYGYMHREGSITTGKFSLRDLDILIIARKILTFAQDKPELLDAAKAYAVTAGLRVYLNAPATASLRQGIEEAQTLLSQHGKTVLADPRLRKKNRYALKLYFFCKPLLRFAYQFVNRWK